jgi:hypothetical protein
VLVPQPPILVTPCVSEVVLSLSHQMGKNNKKNQKNQNTTKCPKFKCNTVSVSFSACRCSLVVVSSKEEEKKTGDSFVNVHLSLRLTCLLLLASCCWRLYCLSLTLTLPTGFVYLEFSCVQPLLLQAFPFPSTLGRWHYIHLLQPACLFTVHMWGVPSLLSGGVFLTPPLL